MFFFVFLTERQKRLGNVRVGGFKKVFDVKYYMKFFLVLPSQTIETKPIDIQLVVIFIIETSDVWMIKKTFNLVSNYTTMAKKIQFYVSTIRSYVLSRDDRYRVYIDIYFTFYTTIYRKYIEMDEQKKISYFDKVSTSTCNLYSTAIMLLKLRPNIDSLPKQQKIQKFILPFPVSNFIPRCGYIKKNSIISLHAPSNVFPRNL